MYFIFKCTYNQPIFVCPKIASLYIGCVGILVGLHLYAYLCDKLYRSPPFSAFLCRRAPFLMMTTVIAEIYLHDRLYHDENYEVAQWAHTHSFIVHDIVHDLEIKFLLVELITHYARTFHVLLINSNYPHDICH